MKSTELPPPFQNALAEAFEGGLSTTETLRRTGLPLALRTVQRRHEYWLLYEELYSPRFVKTGRPGAMTEEQELWLLAYLSERPDAYFSEMQPMLYDDWGIEASAPALSRVLKERKWSRKVARRLAKERNPLLRALWTSRCWKWPSHGLIFIDETACNQKTGQRNYGWSPQGVDCLDMQYAKRETRWSVLPALTLSCYLPCTTVYQGSITADRFLNWLVDDVLPLLPEPMIFVMHNASIHHSVAIKEAKLSAGHRLEFLPPYSPDLNPIEQTFNLLKRFVKKYISEVERFSGFEDYLVWCLRQYAGAKSYSLFKNSGYNVDGVDLDWDEALLHTTEAVTPPTSLDPLAAALSTTFPLPIGGTSLSLQLRR